MTQIYIRDLRIHAFHGVLPQERTVGNDYVINIAIDYPFDKACISDELDDTMSYAEVADIAHKVMETPCRLVERVAYRIGEAIIGKFPLAKSVDVDLMKVAPPMSCDCNGAGVRLTVKRDS